MRATLCSRVACCAGALQTLLARPRLANPQSGRGRASAASLHSAPRASTSGTCAPSVRTAMRIDRNRPASRRTRRPRTHRAEPSRSPCVSGVERGRALRPLTLLCLPLPLQFSPLVTMSAPTAAASSSSSSSAAAPAAAAAAAAATEGKTSADVRTHSGEAIVERAQHHEAAHHRTTPAHSLAHSHSARSLWLVCCLLLCVSLLRRASTTSILTATSESMRRCSRTKCERTST